MGIGRGFVAGLAQGVALGNTTMDTYDRYKLKSELENAGKLDQQETTSLTPNQQSTADYVNNADNGYEVQKLDGGGLKYRTAGSENSWNELTPGLKQYKLGNKVQDTAFTEDQISRARADAQANVYMRNGDPAKGYGLKAAAREDRVGNATEMARDEYMSGLEDLASGKNVDKYMPMILKSYNDAPKGSKYDDGHHATYDAERNLVAFSDKEGRVVNSIPVNPQTMAAAWKERYLDKLSALDPKLGLEREKLAETRDFHKDTIRVHERANDIADKRVGLANSLNPAQDYELQQKKLFDTGKAAIIADLEAGKISETDAAKKIGILGMKYGSGASGLTKADEAVVEYDDGNGNKYKGTPAQVHAARMKTDPTYAAGKGSSLAMPPRETRQAPNQTGKAQQAPQSSTSGPSDAELDSMISDASRGGKTGKAYLQQALSSGELNMSQRQRVEKALNLR